MNIAIIGTGGQGMVVLDILRHDPMVKIVGFIDDDPKKKGSTIEGIPCIGSLRDLPELKIKPGIDAVIIAVGDNARRAKIFSDLKDMKLATAIHPTAIIARDATVGEGSVVCAGAIICTKARVGKNAIINTGATVDHENIIKDHAQVAPGVHLGGNVTVGERTLVGIGATVIQGIAIGDDTIIGAGASVIRNIPGRVMAAGVPAVVKKNLDGK